MLLRAVVVTLLLLCAGVALAASEVVQGECTYAADWKAQATPVTNGGPPMWPYAAIGACAAGFAERGAGNVVRVAMRADVAEASTSSKYVIKQIVESFGTSRGSLTCAASVCEAGPFTGTIEYAGQVCVGMEIWKDAALYRKARACA